MNARRVKGIRIALLWCGCVIVTIDAGIVPARAGTVSYSRLVAAQVMFDKLPLESRDKVRLRVVVRHQSATDHSLIHLWVDSGGHKTDIPLSPDGSIEMRLRRDWIDRGVIVQTDQAAGSLGLVVDVGIKVPAAHSVRTAYLRDAVRQSQAVIAAGARQMAGLLSYFVTPDVRGVSIKLAKCCDESATLGTTTLKQNTKGEIDVPTSLLEASAISTSAPIVQIDPLM